MREIKFRAWNEVNERMIDWKELNIEKDEGDSKISVVVFKDCVGNHYDDFPLMQYTGLKDKNGKEIYEGDVVKFKHEQSDVWEVSEVVYFGDGEWQYPAFDLNAGNLKSHFEAHVLQTIVCSGEYDYKVIGNIYENPELLEVSE